MPDARVIMLLLLLLLLLSQVLVCEQFRSVRAGLYRLDVSKL